MKLTQLMKHDIQKHAYAAYPQEGCGVIVGGSVISLPNTAADPCVDFQLPADAFAGYDVDAVWHSHPDGPEEPSDADMSGQIQTDVPWILCCSYADGTASEPYMWGGDYIPPLVGREFRHGPSGTDDRGDCYALVKDWYKTERGVTLPEFPRANGWWETRPSMYLDNFTAAGFSEATGEPQVGDVALMQISAPVVNHAAIYIGDGLLLQHLTHRLSRRDPATLWQKLIRKWIRYEGVKNADDG